MYLIVIDTNYLLNNLVARPENLLSSVANSSNLCPIGSTLEAIEE